MNELNAALVIFGWLCVIVVVVVVGTLAMIGLDHWLTEERRKKALSAYERQALYNLREAMDLLKRFKSLHYCPSEFEFVLDKIQQRASGLWAGDEMSIFREFVELRRSSEQERARWARESGPK